MNKMVNSCKKTTELIDKKLMGPLSVKDRVQLFFHKSMCKTCASYEHQSKFIDKAVSILFYGKPNNETNLSKEKKQKIIDKINES